MKDWRYDIGAHMPTPSGTLEIKLNDSIIFEFRDRRDMRIKFAQDGFAKELEAGVRPSREGVYLDKRYVPSLLFHVRETRDVVGR